MTLLDSDSVPTTVRINSRQQKHEAALRRLDAGIPFRRHKACGYIIESLKMPLPKPGRHVPSLDMPCGLLGISGTKTRSPESLP